MHQSDWLLQKHRTSAFHSVPEPKPQHSLEHRRLRSFFFHQLVKEPGNLLRIPSPKLPTRNAAFQPVSDQRLSGMPAARFRARR
jgi:hypothetical protein